MNRRTLFKSLAALLPLSIATRLIATTSSVKDDVLAPLPEGAHVIRRSEVENDGKYGYVAIGVLDEQGKTMCRPGDWRVYINGKPSHFSITRANDREGWFEHIERRTLREWNRRDGIADAERTNCPVQREGGNEDWSLNSWQRKDYLDLEISRVTHVKADVRLERTDLRP